MVQVMLRSRCLPVASTMSSSTGSSCGLASAPGGSATERPPGAFTGCTEACMPWGARRSRARGDGRPRCLPVARAPCSATAAPLHSGACCVIHRQPSTSPFPAEEGPAAATSSSTTFAISTEMTAAAATTSPSPPCPARCSTSPRSCRPVSWHAPSTRPSGCACSTYACSTSYANAAGAGGAYGRWLKP